MQIVAFTVTTTIPVVCSKSYLALLAELVFYGRPCAWDLLTCSTSPITDTITKPLSTAEGKSTLPLLKSAALTCCAIVDRNGDAIARAVSVTFERPQAAANPAIPSGRGRTGGGESGGKGLALKVVLEPLRPLRGNVQAVLTHPTGGIPTILNLFSPCPQIVYFASC